MTEILAIALVPLVGTIAIVARQVGKLQGRITALEAQHLFAAGHHALLAEAVLRHLAGDPVPQPESAEGEAQS